MKTKMLVAVLFFGAALVLAPASASAKDAKLTVNFSSGDGKDVGTAVLAPAKNGVQLKLSLKNLAPGDHGIHFHAVAKCEGPDFKSSGGHFNPDNKKHGTKNPAGPHAGDIPLNLTVGPDGTLKQTITVTTVTLDPTGPTSLVANGASIMIHAGADDFMTDPSGNSGARIACAVIPAAK